MRGGCVLKKVYSKPTFYVEPMMMDTPIAANCVADKADMKAIMLFGYFTQEHNCMFPEDSVDWEGDTICYHSNAVQAFLS